MENNNNNAPKMDAPKQEPVKNTQPAPKAPKQTKPKLVSTNKLSFKPESSDDLRTQIDFGDYDDKVDPFQSDEEFKQEWIKNRASNKFKYNPNKIMNKMGLSENDLEPIDQSPLYKAKMAAIEAGKKGGYRDYSDFNEKGELVARPARTVSLLGDSNKFHPDAQIRGIKDFGDHFEYQLKNPGDADFSNWTYSEKEGNRNKDLLDSVEQQNEQMKKEGRWKPDWTEDDWLDKALTDLRDEYGLDKEINEKEVEEQLKLLGADEKNMIPKVMEMFKNDEEYRKKYGWSQKDWYKPENTVETKEKEYDNIDDDYERSYGPVTNDKEYQAYLKWKENGDSFDNIDSKIRNQMGLDEDDVDSDFATDTKINSSFEKLYNSGALDVSGNVITPDNVKKIYDDLGGKYTEDDIINALENHSSFRKPHDYEPKTGNQMELDDNDKFLDREYAETQKYFNNGKEWTNQIGGLTTGLMGDDLKNALNKAFTKRGFKDLWVDEHNQQNDNITPFVITDQMGYKVNGWYDRDTGRLGLEPQSIKAKNDGWYQDKIARQMGLGNENSQAEADVKKLLDLTDNKYGITLSNAIDDLKKYPEDSLLGDNKAISQLMNRFGLSKEDVIKALNYKFDGLI